MSNCEDPCWLALSPARRAALLDKHRYSETRYHDWWNGVHEQFNESCLEVGIRVDRIQFSGFSCQGDGASFEGQVEDWPKFLALLGKPELAKLADEERWQFSSMSRGHYSHSGCMSFTAELGIPDNPYDAEDDLLRHATWAIANPVTEAVIKQLETGFSAQFRELADKLYKNLETEHDWLTDDEQVIERILDDEDAMSDSEDVEDLEEPA